MKQQIGYLFQVFALIALPMTILYQLEYSFPVFVMPVCLVIGIGVFSLGGMLRNSTG